MFGSGRHRSWHSLILIFHQAVMKPRRLQIACGTPHRDCVGKGANQQSGVCSKTLFLVSLGTRPGGPLATGTGLPSPSNPHFHGPTTVASGCIPFELNPPQAIRYYHATKEAEARTLLARRTTDLWLPSSWGEARLAWNLPSDGVAHATERSPDSCPGSLPTSSTPERTAGRYHVACTSAEPGYLPRWPDRGPLAAVCGVGKISTFRVASVRPCDLA